MEQPGKDRLLLHAGHSWPKGPSPERASPLAGGDQLPSRDRGLGEAGEVAGLSLRQNTLGGTLLSPLRKLAQM